jgi:hypothetical protein
VICEHVGTAALVDTVVTRPVPGSLVDANDAGHDPLGDLGGQSDCPEFIEHIHQITVDNVSLCCVPGADPHSMRLQPAKPRDGVQT